MISTSTTDPNTEPSSKIYACMTYYSNKLGPRLVGTADDWELSDFSKEALFYIVHDSMLIRSKKSLLFIENANLQKYKVYIMQYRVNFTDYHYEGTKYAICFFIPEEFEKNVRIKESFDNFPWTEYITSSGSAKELCEVLKSRLDVY